MHQNKFVDWIQLAKENDPTGLEQGDSTAFPAIAAFAQHRALHLAPNLAQSTRNWRSSSTLGQASVKPSGQRSYLRCGLPAVLAELPPGARIIPKRCFPTLLQRRGTRVQPTR